ncbi:hypothetical protein LX36DRAFT_251515 [Colletotrichum falcatum]|nr:hypothetical protein LX36DRAFT_251515 [Colletotrichum falcatum]
MIRSRNPVSRGRYGVSRRGCQASPVEVVRRPFWSRSLHGGSLRWGRYAADLRELPSQVTESWSQIWVTWLTRMVLAKCEMGIPDSASTATKPAHCTPMQVWREIEGQAAILPPWAANGRGALFQVTGLCPLKGGLLKVPARPWIISGLSLGGIGTIPQRLAKIKLPGLAFCGIWSHLQRNV